MDRERHAGRGRAADGDFDAQEKAIVVEIARELGLDPKDFDL
jgi:tellurite resistance protein TerB